MLLAVGQKAHQVLVIPQDRLPRDEAERKEALARYFQRQIATAMPGPDGWQVDLAWPDGADFYLDPALPTGLAWFAPDLQVSGIPLAVRQDDGFQLSLHDSWTLLSWSCWLQEWEGQEPPTILHLDSHRDLMSPRLERTGEGWVDLLSDEPVDLRQPSSIVGAIRSGAIGIGSYIAPWVHEMPAARLLHLCSSRHLPSERGAHAMRPVLVGDDPLFPGSRRPGIDIGGNESDEAGGGGGLYFVSDDQQRLLDQLPASGPILLHIDMDYFNNRFDGHFDWQRLGSRHDPSEPEVLAAIDAFFEALAARRLGTRVVDVAVALSPAFFPAELWDGAVARVRRCVSTLGAMQGSAE